MNAPASTTTPLSTGVTTAVPAEHHTTLLQLHHKHIYTSADIEKHACLHIRRLFSKLYTKPMTVISTATIQPAAIMLTNKYSLRKQAITVKFTFITHLVQYQHAVCCSITIPLILFSCCVWRKCHTLLNKPQINQMKQEHSVQKRKTVRDDVQPDTQRLLK